MKKDPSSSAPPPFPPTAVEKSKRRRRRNLHLNYFFGQMTLSSSSSFPYDSSLFPFFLGSLSVLGWAWGRGRKLFFFLSLRSRVGNPLYPPFLTPQFPCFVFHPSSSFLEGPLWVGIMHSLPTNARENPKSTTQ